MNTQRQQVPPAPTETFGTAEDGTVLKWEVYTPAGVPSWPAVLVTHGGGFKTEEQANKLMIATCQDLQAAGFIVFANHYRLAPPGTLPGQVADGRYPQQHADMTIAIRAARADLRTTGKVGGVGGSAGATHVAYAAGVGMVDDDRIDVAVALSGAYNYAERAANPGLAHFVSDVTNYCNSTDLAVLLAASPMTLVDDAINPLFLVNSPQDSMPLEQLSDMAANLSARGVTNFQALTLSGRGHAFALWPQVKTQAIEFLAAALI